MIDSLYKSVWSKGLESHVAFQEVQSPQVRGLLAAPGGPLGRGCRGGCVTAELSARTRGLVKRAQDDVNNGTSQTQTPGYRAVTAISPAST